VDGLTLVALSAVGFLLACIAITAFGLRFSVAAACIGALFVAPFALTTEPQTFHVGIAGPIPEVRTFTVVLVLIAIAALFSGRTPLAMSFAPFALFMLWGTLFVWPDSEIVRAGILQLFVGVLAFSAGRWIGQSTSNRESNDVKIARMLAAIVVVQAIVCVLQVVGLSIFALDSAETAILGTRANGISNHPNTLGKLLVFLMLFALPLTRSARATARKWALVALFGSFLPLALTQGRANIIAAVMILVVWAILLPRTKKIGLKEAILAGAVLISLGVAGVVLSRFDEDPTGGVRGQILDYAMTQISLNPLWGVGPNFYTSVVGPVTGSWIPVHNSFLLAVAELGLLGGALLFVPILLVLRRAWAHRSDSRNGDYSKALITSVLPLLLIGLTGWGLLGTSVLATWMFVFGWLDGAASLPSPAEGISVRRLALNGSVDRVPLDQRELR
jgi:hypothetical protein